MSNSKYSKSFKLDAVRLALSSDINRVEVVHDLGLKKPIFMSGSKSIAVKCFASGLGHQYH